MGKKKEKPINLNELEEEEKMKYEIAEELGLLDRVLAQGWKSLTSKETGRIGGLVTKRRRTQENGTAQTEENAQNGEHGWVIYYDRKDEYI